MKPPYIALEGIEGSGKSTVANRLVDLLADGPRRVTRVREPGGTVAGERIRGVLLDTGSFLSPWAEALLFAASRAQLAHEVVGPALESGSWVVSDRTVYSSLAYQGGGRGLGIATVRALNEPGLEGLWPDLVVLLRIDAATGLERQEVADRIGGEGLEFQAAVAAAFDEIARAEPERFLVVDATQDITAVIDDVVAGGARPVVDVFEGFIGNRSVIDLLTDEIAHPAHAYLFVGPGSTGKATAARRFAAALLCDEADASCRRRAIGATHPDLVLIEPEGRASITVDQARHAVSQASLAPMEGERKLFLFEEGGMMNDEAANALLKTLEEPSESTIFIIVAESESDLPDTIASRCRTIVFGRVEDDTLRAGLEGIGIEPDQAERAARISGGRPGLALSLATRHEVAEYRSVWLSVPLRIPDHPGDAFVLADEVMTAAEPLLAALKDRQQQESTAAESQGGGGRALKDRHDRELRRASAALYVSGLEILAGFYRDAAAAQFGAAVRNPDIPASALTKVRPPVAAANIERIMVAVESLQANQRPQLAFAALFADLGVAS